jgi:hypothetical protein
MSWVEMPPPLMFGDLTTAASFLLMLTRSGATARWPGGVGRIASQVWPTG